MRVAQSKTANTRMKRTGFTIVELLLVIVTIAILAMIVLVAYGSVQHRAADGVTQTTVSDAFKTMQLYYVNNRTYPPNVADTEYVPPLTVAVTLFTNASQVPTYQNLTTSQNAQLFLNTCNGYMPTTDGTTTYNTECDYNGNNLHVKGTTSSNVVIQGPTVNQSDFVLTCGSACAAAQTSIINTFLQQGGSFPITVPKSGSTLPAPTLITVGTATQYCLQGLSTQFADVEYHVTETSSMPESGPCPVNAALHYP